MANATTLPVAHHPNHFPPDGIYIVVRDNLLFDGKRYAKGEPLDEACSIRKRPESLAVHVRYRNLVLAPSNYQPPEAAKPAVSEEPKAEQQEAPTVSPELMTLPLHKLQDLCKENGVDHVGNKAQLRKRLSSVLGG